MTNETNFAPFSFNLPNQPQKKLFPQDNNCIPPHLNPMQNSNYNTHPEQNTSVNSLINSLKRKLEKATVGDIEHQAENANKKAKKFEVIIKTKVHYDERVTTYTLNDHGAQEGKAKTIWNDGRVKLFEMHNGVMHGKVTEKSEKGESEYTVINGNKDGKLISKTKNGATIEKNFSKGVEGDFKKETYSSSYYSECKKGKSTHFFKNGDVGEWNRNEFCNGKSIGKGTLTILNGPQMQCDIEVLGNPIKFTFTNEHGNKFVYLNGERQSEPPTPYKLEIENGKIYLTNFSKK